MIGAVAVTAGLAVQQQGDGSPQAGYRGSHEYEVLRVTDHGRRLRHRLHMTTRWPALMTWPLFYRPLHNALGLALPRPSRWSLPV